MHAAQLTIVYALEEPPLSYQKAVFAAGPTPRSAAVASWRPGFVAALRAAGFDGVLFVPESRDGRFHGDYLAQVEWEERMLARADVVAFWVPRELEQMPALTTNVEWGAWCDSGKAVLGCPPEAPRNDYLRYYADKLKVPRSETLEGTAAAVVAALGEGALRSGAERDIPLPVWRTPSFATWYASQVAAGHLLIRARVLWTFRL